MGKSHLSKSSYFSLAFWSFCLPPLPLPCGLFFAFCYLRYASWALLYFFLSGLLIADTSSFDLVSKVSSYSTSFYSSFGVSEFSAVDSIPITTLFSSLPDPFSSLFLVAASYAVVKTSVGSLANSIEISRSHLPSYLPSYLSSFKSSLIYAW